VRWQKELQAAASKQQQQQRVQLLGLCQSHHPQQQQQQHCKTQGLVLLLLRLRMLQLCWSMVLVAARLHGDMCCSRWQQQLAYELWLSIELALVSGARLGMSRSLLHLGCWLCYV
jgi:hypothetical protein